MPRSRNRRRPTSERSHRVLSEALERRLFLTATPVSIPSPPPRPLAADAVVAMTAEPQYALSVPGLSSYPSATAKLYLDFDGQPATDWEGTAVPATPAYSVDGNTTSFSATELANINEIWSRVAEKYAPFNIDVTTIRPTDFNNLHAVQVVIGGDGSWSSGGGVAYVDAFNNSLSNTCWVFSAQSPTDLQFVAEAAAHEAGHTFGLQHQSEYSGTTNVQEYSDNDPATTGNTFTAQPTSPIMGYSYDATRGLWWKGKNYVSSTTIQDDMAVISKAANGFGYRTDDAGGTPGTATVMTLSGTAATAKGVIEKTTDADYFAFQSLPGTVTFTVSVPAKGPTLDAVLELRNASNGLLVSKDTASLGETLSFIIPTTGNYYVVVKSHGSYGDVGNYSLAGTINAVPLTADPGGPYAVAEGGTVQLSASASLGQIKKYEWDLDYDGVTFNADRTGSSPSVTAGAFDGPSTRTIALRLTDTADNTLIATTTLAVTNANPTATLTNSGAVEGSTTATVTFTSPTDPSSVDLAAGLTYSYDFDDDGTFDLVTSSPSATIPAALVADGPATLSVRARVADKDGGFTDYTTAVPVTNRLPTATMTADLSVPQSGTATITFATPVDAAADVSAGFTYSYDFDNDGTFDLVTTQPSATVPASALGDTPGARTVRGRISDKDGGHTDYTASVTVTNVAPTATLSTSAGDEGSDLVVSLLSPFDPSPADAAAGFKYSFDLNNDGSFEVVKSSSNSFTYSLPDQGSYTVLARIYDRNNGFTNYVVTISAANLAPTATLAVSPTVAEGSSGTITLTAATDPSPADAAAGFTYSYDFNDDGTFEVTDSTSPTATVPATYLADGPFTRTVHARVTDKDGGHSDYTADIAVTNVAPTILTPAAANAHVILGTGYALSVAAQDPGHDTVSAWTIHWGDGSTSQKSSATAVFSHDYAAKGNYTLTISAADEDGSFSLDRALSVTSTPPTATFAAGSLSSDSSAFRFTLSYDDDLGVRADTLGSSDVSVTGPHGAAKSVRLVSSSPTSGGRGETVTYEATGPAGAWAWQDDGTYTVSVNPAEIVDLQGDSLQSGPIGDFSVSLIAPDAPDLVPLLTGSLNTKPGAKNTVTVKLSNRGDRTLPATNITTSLYLSRDATWDPSDKLLTSVTQKLALAINGSKSLNLSFATPAVTATGTYYILARADSKEKVTERDERNNVSASKKFNLTTRITPHITAATHPAKLKKATNDLFNLSFIPPRPA